MCLCCVCLCVCVHVRACVCVCLFVSIYPIIKNYYMYKCMVMVIQALCEVVAKTKIMSAEQVVKDEQGEEVRVVYVCTK